MTIDSESLKQLQAWYQSGSQYIRDLPADTPVWCWPTDERIITQDYGADPGYYSQFKLTEKGYYHPKFPNGGHEGEDIATRESTNIYAMRDGVAYKVFFPSNPQDYAYGNQIRIEHELNGAKYRTVYAHLKRASSTILQGQPVKGGTVIAQAGNTGNSRGVHLHLTVYQWFDSVSNHARLKRYRIINPAWLFMGITGV